MISPSTLLVYPQSPLSAAALAGLFTSISYWRIGYSTVKFIRDVTYRFQNGPSSARFDPAKASKTVSGIELICAVFLENICAR